MKPVFVKVALAPFRAGTGRAMLRMQLRIRHWLADRVWDRLQSPVVAIILLEELA